MNEFDHIVLGAVIVFSAFIMFFVLIAPWDYQRPWETKQKAIAESGNSFSDKAFEKLRRMIK